MNGFAKEGPTNFFLSFTSPCPQDYFGVNVSLSATQDQLLCYNIAPHPHVINGRPLNLLFATTVSL